VGIEHVVQAGQTLWRIARAYGVTVETLAQANHLSDPTLIETGQRLFIPGAERVLEVPPYRPDGIPPDQAGHAHYIWPVTGTVSSGFGMRNGRRHTGLDIRAPSGTPVQAARAGTVAYAGAGFRGYGNLVILDHGDGDRTYYAHNRKILVREGQAVGQGEVIAQVGRTGRTTGPHLHFEIRRGNRILDPRDHLPHRGRAARQELAPHGSR
jgi:murein DD-endopeptidase MepM/ murein hydrolase activator NlpD